MVRHKHVLDSESDEEIGWSKTFDLPKSRAAVAFERKLAKRRALAADHNDTSSPGPSSKRALAEPRLAVPDHLSESERRLHILNWPEKLLDIFVTYLRIEDKIKIRCTCRAFKELVDKQEQEFIREVFVRRLDETELGLFTLYRQERFVIHNKNLTWQPSNAILRPFSVIRRGHVDWTRHDQTRLGRIQTAIKAMLKLAWIDRLNVYQVNLSNSLIRDICRALKNRWVQAIDISYQVYDYEHPDLHLLFDIPCDFIGLSCRLSPRDPSPPLEHFLHDAVRQYEKIVIDVRENSWKFFTCLNYRKTVEEYGMNGAALIKYMRGECNFLRLKLHCRNLTKDDVLATISFLRLREKSLASRGFSIILYRAMAENIFENIATQPPYETLLSNEDLPITNHIKPRAHSTTAEHLELRHIYQDSPKTPLSEIRYYRKGSDFEALQKDFFYDDSQNWDPFELPRHPRMRPA